MDRSELFASYAAHVNKGKIDVYTKYGYDAVFGRREGARVWDTYTDRSWINCHVNGGTYNLGHRNPTVLAAVQSALDRCDIGNHHLPAPGRVELAERLSATTGGLLPGVVYGVGGGEAIDLAIKVARAATGRPGIVSASGGYHGHTGLALAAGDAKYRDAFGPNPPGFSQVPFNDVTAMDGAVTEETAAVLLEPVPATLGMPIPDTDYLPAVERICRDRGAKLIIDEVQTGLGRTGRIWAFQHWDLEPDALVTSKGLSGGIYPISATLMTRELHEIFDTEPFIHISTFGGAEPGTAAGLAVLDVIEAPGFLERVLDLEGRFVDGLAGMPFAFRHLGLMMALAFPVADAGMMAMKLLFDAGLFTTYAGNDTSVLQFLPPLIISDDEAAEVIEIVRSVFG
jgi:acetylornithine/succinyldiaminopimelate/putrescine aminotransferase